LGEGEGLSAFQAQEEHIASTSIVPARSEELIEDQLQIPPSPSVPITCTEPKYDDIDFYVVARSGEEGRAEVPFV
jgi:hypothetical protein